MEPHPILLFTIFTIPLAFLTAIVNVYAPPAAGVAMVWVIMHAGARCSDYSFG